MVSCMTSSEGTATSIHEPPSRGDTETTSSGRAWPTSLDDFRRRAGPATIPMKTEIVLLAAWVAIGLGGALDNGSYSTGAVLLVVVGTLLLVFAAATRSERAGEWGRVATVTAGCAVLLGFHDAAGIYGSGPALIVSRLLTSVATVVVSVWLIVGLPRRDIATYAAIIVMTAAGAAMVVSSPRPLIDVWYMLQGSGRALSHGENIYTIRWTTGVGYEQSNGFAYLPGAAVLLWPFHALFGDVRYGLLAAISTTAILLARVRANSPLVILATFVMLYPKTMFGLEQSWVDPLVLCALCAAAYAVVRGRHGWAVLAFAVALACKQQAWLVLPLAFFWKDFGWRRAALSATGAGAFMLPWIVTAPHAFYSGVVTYNLDLPARQDSLSLFTTALRHGWSPGLGVALVASLGAIGLVLWRRPRDTYGFLLGSAVIMAVFNLTNKQSFFNEWALAAGLGLAALVFHTGLVSDSSSHQGSAETAGSRIPAIRTP
jgi:hypothetical protein